MTILGELFTVPNDDWVDGAICTQVDPEAWFPDALNIGKEAKAICYTCPVRAECARYAFEHDERYGIFGGLSQSDRDKLRHGQNPMSTCRTNRQANGHGFNCRCPVCTVKRSA